MSSILKEMFFQLCSQDHKKLNTEMLRNVNGLQETEIETDLTNLLICLSKVTELHPKIWNIYISDSQLPATLLISNMVGKHCEIIIICLDWPK